MREEGSKKSREEEGGFVGVGEEEGRFIGDEVGAGGKDFSPLSRDQ